MGARFRRAAIGGAECGAGGVVNRGNRQMFNPRGLNI